MPPGFILKEIRHPNKNYDASNQRNGFVGITPIVKASFYIETIGIISTYVTEGASRRAALEQAAKENNLKLEWKYYSEFDREELIGVHRKDGTAIKKDAEAGLHFFYGKDGIPVIADVNERIQRFINLDEDIVTRQTAEATIGKRSSAADPKTVGELRGGEAEKIKELETAHGGGSFGKGELEDNTVILVVHVESGKVDVINNKPPAMENNTNREEYSPTNPSIPDVIVLFEFQGRIFDRPSQDDNSYVLRMIRDPQSSHEKHDDFSDATAPAAPFTMLNMPMHLAQHDHNIDNCPKCQTYFAKIEKRKERNAPIPNEESVIIRLLMNPTERKLWGKLYGLPDEDDARKTYEAITPAANMRTIKMQKVKAGISKIPKPAGLKLKNGKKVEVKAKKAAGEEGGMQEEKKTAVTPQQARFPRLMWGAIMGNKKESGQAKADDAKLNDSKDKKKANRTERGIKRPEVKGKRITKKMAADRKEDAQNKKTKKEMKIERKEAMAKGIVTKARTTKQRPDAERLKAMEKTHRKSIRIEGRGKREKTERKVIDMSVSMVSPFAGLAVIGMPKKVKEKSELGREERARWIMQRNSGKILKRIGANK